MPGATTGTIFIAKGTCTTTSSSNFTVTPTPYPSVQQGSKLVGIGTIGSTIWQGQTVSVSADGNTAIVGGHYDNSGIGAAWIYTRTGGVWTQQGSKLVGTGSISQVYQGWSVSISADGNTAIVGGYYDNNQQGAAWVYTRTAGVWTQQGSKLVGTGNTSAARQGYSVSLSADGNTAIVGGYNDNGAQGAVWIYARTAGVWTQQGSKLVGTGNTGAANQGYSVCLSPDGNTAIVGGNADDSNQGAAWVYTRTGGVWTQQGSKLVGTGNTGAAYQGYSVSLSADGNTAMVGGNDDNIHQGAAWVYTRSGGVWTQQGSKLVGTGGTATAYQGNSVSLSADGNTAMVGGYNDNGALGAVWVYTRTGGVWTQQGSKLVGTGSIDNARQGYSVSLSADGNTSFVGGYYDNSEKGASWVFKVCSIPNISSQSTATQTKCLNGTFTAITVTATGDMLTYQWYSNTTSSNSGGTTLGSANGAQTNSYTPQATTVGTLYYYCVVTSGACIATSAVSGAFITNTATVISSQSTATQTQCLNGSFTPITVTATGTSLTYQWYSNTTASNSGGTTLGSTNGAQTYSYTPPATTANTRYYYCVVTGTCGTQTSAISGAFVTNPLTTISSQATATQTKCLNGTFTAITVTATGTSLAYQWYSNTIASNSGGTTLGSANGAQTSSYTPQSTIAGTLYYYCVVTGTCGTQTSAVSGAFITNPATVINSQSTDAQTQCLNGSYTPITVTATGTSITYQWYYNTIASNSGGTSLGTAVGARTASYTPLSTTANTRYYYCVVSGTCGASQTSAVSGAFVTNPLTSISSQSTATQTRCLNAAFTAITVTASGANLTYQWYWNNISSNSGGTSLGSANGAQTNSYTPQSTTAGTLYYYCVVTGTCGTVTSAVSGAFITNLLTVISSQSTDAQSQCVGGSYTPITVAATGASLTYQWYYNTTASNSGGVSLSTANGAQTAIYTPPATAANTRYYYCVVSGTCGAQTSAVSGAFITNLVTSISSQSTAAQTRCFSAAFTAITVTATGTNLTYQWYSNTVATNSGGTSLGSANGAQTFSYTPQSTTAGTLYYYCVVTGTCGTAKSAVSGASITNPATVISSQSTASQSQCVGGSYTPVTVTASGANLSYQWYWNSVANNSGGTSLSSANGAQTASYTPPATTANTRYYYCIVTGTCGSQTSAISGAFITNLVTAISSQATATQTKCLNGTFTAITVTATGTSLAYQWYSNTIASNSGGTTLGSANGAQTNSYTPQSTTAGTLYYYCIVTGTCGTQTTTISGAFITNPATVISSQSTDAQTQCINGSFTPITVTASGTGTLTYQWYSNTIASNSGGTSLVATNGARTASYTPQATTASTLYYYCVVTGTCGTVTSAVSGAFITNSLNAISSQSTANQTRCLNGTFNPITVTAIGGNLTYQWYSNTIASNSGGTSLGTDNGAQTNSYTPQVTILGTIYYYCVVTGTCGTTQTSAVSGAFTVTDQSTISSFSPSSGSVGTLVTITGTNLINATNFTIGGVPAIIVSSSETTITGMVMPGATTGTIVVGVVPCTATSASNFTVTPTPFPMFQQGSKIVGTGALGDGRASQGNSVSISADGNTAIVAGFWENTSYGAVWIYTRAGGVWTQQGVKLVGTGAVGAANQGSSVSISADGNTAIVGGNADNSYVGAVWIYTRAGGVWTQQGDKLVGTGAVGNANQGYSVSLSADGNTAMVGGLYDNTDKGAVWVFTRSGGTWSQQGSKLVGTGAVGNAQQGYAVSLSADGNTAMVGGIYDNTDKGAVWVFTRSGGTWSQQGSKLFGTGAVGNAYQGSSVSISADGNTAMVGGQSDNSSVGAVWVFTRSAGVWSQQGSKLVGTGGVGSSGQGQSVSLSADGNTAIVGGPNNENNSGAFWIYTRSGGVWTQQGKFQGSGRVGLGGYQGWSVSLSADGTTAIEGAMGENDFIGAAWVYIHCTLPNIISQSTATQTQCLNGTFTPITISATGTNLTYQWFSNTIASNSDGTTLGSANGAQTATYTPQATIAGTKYYYCIVTSGTCDTTSAVSGAFVVYNTKPSISSQPLSPSAGCSGSNSFNLTVEVLGTPKFDYQWQVNDNGWKNLSNGGVYGSTAITTHSESYSNTLSITNVDNSYNGKQYRCVVKNCSVCDSVISNGSAALSVYSSPTIIIGGCTICSGSSATISASGASTYSWSNGLGSSSSKTVSPTISTTYTLTGTDGNSCTNTSQAVVSVHTTGAVTQTSINSGDWNTASTWGNGIVPLTCDNVVIDRDVTVLSGANVACINLKINNSKTLTCTSGSLSINGNLTNNGIFLHNNGTVIFNSNDTVFGSSITGFNHVNISGSLTGHSTNMNVAGNWINNGTYQHNNGKVTFNGNTLYNGTSTTTFNNVDISAGKFLTIDTGGKTMRVSNKIRILASGPSGMAQLVIKDNNSYLTGTGNNDSVYVQIYDSLNSWHYLSAPIDSNYMGAMVYKYFFGKTYNETKNIYEWYNGKFPLIAGRGFTLKWNETYNDPKTGLPIRPASRLISIPTKISKLHSGSISYPVTNTPGFGDGWNLVGNPYPCSIDWEASAGWSSTNVDPTIYLYDALQKRYSTYNKNTHVGTNSGTRYIPSQQGLYIHCTASGQWSMDNRVRIAYNQPFWKGVESNDLMMANQLNIVISGNIYSDESAIVFTDAASVGFDQQYDAYKLLSPEENVPQINTLTLDNERIKTAFNCLPSELMYNSSVPVDINIGVAGSYTITAGNLTIDPSVEVTLEDLKTHKKTNLRTSNYTFTSEPVSNDSRFVIHFGAASPTNIHESNSANINIYADHNQIVVKNTNNSITKGTITVYDMQGKQITERNMEPNTTTLIDLEQNNAQAIYLVKVTNGEKSISQKVCITR